MAKRKKAASATTKPAEDVERTTAYKAFDADFQCRGFQYEVGKTYRHEGNVVICASGFHAVENYMDVWNYYPLHGSRYAEVELVGPVVRHDEDSKIAGAEIVIKAELKLPEFIKRATARLVEWITSRADSNIATGDSGHAAATGNGGHAAATGYSGHATATGYRGHAAATGYSGHATATGYRGHAAATGDRGHAAATGYSGHATATGNGGHAAATGYRGHAAATGYRGHAAATGDNGHAAATGKNSIAVSLGYAGAAMAGPCGAIMLACYDDDGQLLAVAASKVGDNGVEPNVAYRLSADGVFIPA